MTDRDREFLKILNADSLLNLSLTEKLVYECFYNGMTDLETARALNMPKNTVTSFRRRLRRLYQASRSIIDLCDMMKFDPVPRKYSSNKPDRNRIVCMNEDLYITGIKSKTEAHSSETPLLHPSVIILPFVKKKDQLRFAVCEKNKGIVCDMNRFDSAADTRIFTDIPGGHLKPEYLPELVPGVKIDDSLWKRAVAAELEEELKIVGEGIDGERLQFLFFDRTSRRLSGTEEFNEELSAVYAYRLGDVPESKVRIYDEYTDSLGVSYRYRFPSRFVDFGELVRIAEGNHQKYQPMDALQRVVKKMREDRTQLEKLNS